MCLKASPNPSTTRPNVRFTYQRLLISSASELNIVLRFATISAIASFAPGIIIAPTAKVSSPDNSPWYASSVN